MPRTEPVFRKPRPLCRVCGIRPVHRRDSRRWKTRCANCNGSLAKLTVLAIERKRKDRTEKAKCEMCGFVPTHPVQMDRDHKDGNHENNAPENIQILCANCHRLKTILRRDWRTRQLKSGLAS